LKSAGCGASLHGTYTHLCLLIASLPPINHPQRLNAYNPTVQVVGTASVNRVSLLDFCRHQRHIPPKKNYQLFFV
jgi:hypothetical protein